MASLRNRRAAVVGRLVQGAAVLLVLLAFSACCTTQQIGDPNNPAECGRKCWACCAQGEACQPGTKCNSVGNCEALCGFEGNICCAQATCNAGLDCVNSICKPAPAQPVCKPGDPCTISGLKGSCAKGQVDCSSGQKTCKQVTFAQAETCDGVDNDCDGVKDDIAAAACEAKPSGCQSGFKAPGRQKCQNGKLVCVAEAPKDYCTTCDAGPHCGQCGGQPCAGDFGSIPCTPGSVCSGPPGQVVCHEEQAPPACWLPLDQ